MELHNLNDIAAFVASVDTGSFTAAARQLGLTRSAVGKSIVRLESRLQVRLLNRTTRSLSLTDDGRVLYERCVGILQDLDEVEEALAFRRSTPSGRLRMSLPVALGRLHVVQHIERCLRDWPSLAIDDVFRSAGRPDRRGFRSGDSHRSAQGRLRTTHAHGGLPANDHLCRARLSERTSGTADTRRSRRACVPALRERWPIAAVEFSRQWSACAGHSCWTAADGQR